MQKQSSRLSNDVSPENYIIEIEPSKDMQKYEGRVMIKSKVEKPTKDITLHSKNLEIQSATICVGTQCLLPSKKIDEKRETLTLENIKNIPKGEIEIHIEFSGKITENLQGIYRSKYEKDGSVKHIITTQCESPYARKIFPCFDEPDKKATFELTVSIEKNLSAIANMPIKNETSSQQKKRIEFKTTPKMPTYLFYVGIGEFEFIESQYKSVKIRVATTPGKSENGKFAIEHARKYLEYFENYSEIPYPLEKLDLIAVPDFSAGAMENWGAITFRELGLLVNENTSARLKKRTAELIAHELWHQWSGNLVTMKWWNDLWLNESFANYMAYKAVAHFNPEWNMWEDYLANEYGRGMFKDTLKSTHPIEVEVNSPDEIEEIFDDISYSKGGSILRMLEAYVGEEQFRIGVANYLKENSYSNAEAHDLWNSISETSGGKIKELMKSWISQEGHPIIKIRHTNTGIEVSQERCNKKTNQIWPIPLSIATDSICYNKILEKKEDHYQIKSEYIKLNHEQYGFYRVKYSPEDLKKLGKLVFEKKFGVADRWGIHNDLWVITNIGQGNLLEYLEFLQNYSNESSFIILAEIATNIRKIDRLYSEEKWWPKILSKITDNILPAYKHALKNLGWDEKSNESMESTLMRNVAISFCAFAKDKDTIIEAQSRYARKEVSMNIADAVYYAVARNGDEGTFKEMQNRYIQANDVEPKAKLLVGLYHFKQPGVLMQALNFAISEEVRVQDLRYIFGNLPSNPQINEVIKKWAVNSWSKLKKFEDIHYVFGDFLNALIISQKTKEAKKAIEELLEKQKVAFERTKANAFEILDMNLKLIENNKKDLSKM